MSQIDPQRPVTRSERAWEKEIGADISPTNSKRDDLGFVHPCLWPQVATSGRQGLGDSSQIRGGRSPESGHVLASKQLPSVTSSKTALNLRRASNGRGTVSQACRHCARRCGGLDNASCRRTKPSRTNASETPSGASPRSLVTNTALHTRFGAMPLWQSIARASDAVEAALSSRLITRLHLEDLSRRCSSRNPRWNSHGRGRSRR